MVTEVKDVNNDTKDVAPTTGKFLTTVLTIILARILNEFKKNIVIKST